MWGYRHLTNCKPGVPQRQCKLPSNLKILNSRESRHTRVRQATTTKVFWFIGRLPQLAAVMNCVQPVCNTTSAHRGVGCKAN